MQIKFLTKAICLHFFLIVLSLQAGYTKPSRVSEEVWNEVQPYLLPFDHPLRRKLDKLFSKSRVTENETSVKKAGFLKPKPKLYSKAIVSTNKKIEGYFFKFYNDQQQIDVESKQWIDRASGARSLQKAIDEHGYSKYFVVPKKWIYPIPDYPEPTGPYPKNFVLIATKIEIMKGDGNKHKWLTKPTRKLLDALWILGMQEGLVDNFVIHNSPYTFDNKVAFVDLEQHHVWPVFFFKLNWFLNPDMQEYWTHLMNNNGP